MNIHIPTIGERIILSKPWQFTLYGDYRNTGLFKSLGFHCDRYGFLLGEEAGEEKEPTVELPPSTTLTVGRIYIRAGAGDYDSVTFTIPRNMNLHIKWPVDTKLAIRFWAKLHDVNTIEGNFLPPIPRQPTRGRR
jgi:hypothetical protein